MSNYLKAIVGAAGALVMLLHAVLSDQAISFDEASGVWQAVIALLTAVGVYAVPNRPTG